MKKFKIQLTETKTFISEFNSLERAMVEVKLYELYDYKDDVYTPNFYEIVECKQEKKSTKQLKKIS